MPSFSCSSSFRTASEHFILNVKFVHRLYYASPSDVAHKVKGRLPKELDILALSDLIFIVSGSLDGQIVPSDEIVRSALVHRLRSDVNANAFQLGINNVSDPYIDENDGLVKMTLTPSRSISHTSRPHAILVAVELFYIWKTIGNRKTSDDSTKLLNDADPFSDHLYLPFESPLKRVTEQLFTNQLVGRYPLIFGTWCRRLDMEAVYFPSVAQSVLEIIRRSPNPHFVTRCKQLIKTARVRHQSVLHASAAALSLCFAPSDVEGSESNTSALTTEAVLCETLEQLFRMGVPHTRFKDTAARSSPSVRNDDQLVEASQDDAVFNSDFSLIWPNLPDVHMNVSAETVDTQQTLPDDMDNDLDDWLEEVSTGYTFTDMLPTQRDNSLINVLDSNPSTITPAAAGPSPTGSADNSFTLDLDTDYEQENNHVEMENAELERADMFPPFLLDYLPQSLVVPETSSTHCLDECGELEDFEELDDTTFENEDEMLFDLMDALDESAGLGPLCVSQAPSYTPDQEVFFQVTSNAAGQAYVFGTPLDTCTNDDQVDQGSEDSFTDVWDL